MNGTFGKVQKRWLKTETKGKAGLESETGKAGVCRATAGNVGKSDRQPTEVMALRYSAHSTLRPLSSGLVTVYWFVLLVILWTFFSLMLIISSISLSRGFLGNHWQNLSWLKGVARQPDLGI